MKNLLVAYPCGINFQATNKIFAKTWDSTLALGKHSAKPFVVQLEQFFNLLQLVDH